MPTELFDVDPETVGLVKRGANKRRFFIVKGDNMDEKEQALGMIEELAQEEPSPASWQKLLKSIALFFAPPKPAEQEPEGQTLEERMEALEKAQEEKLAKVAGELAEAQAKLAKAEEEAEAAGSRVTELEKAAGLAKVEPVAKSAGMDPALLYRLSVADPEVYQAVVERFQAFGKQVDETDLWKEAGTAQPGAADPKSRFDARVEALVTDEGLSRADAVVKAAQEMPVDYAAISKNAVKGEKNG